MRVVHHPEAQAELIEAAQYYEAKVAGLGARFLDGVDFAVSEILEAPTRNRVHLNGVRHHLMQRFPFAIYYKVHAEEIRILAFKHHSRHPDYWRYRLHTPAKEA